MSNPAWQVRESERQELLNQLKTKTWDFDDKHDNRAMWYIAEVCLAYLKDPSIQSGQSLSHQFFFGTVLKEISDFSRADEERDSMLADFMEWVVKSMATKFHSKLQEKELEDPQTIFRVPTATSEAKF